MNGIKIITLLIVMHFSSSCINGCRGLVRNKDKNVFGKRCGADVVSTTLPADPVPDYTKITGGNGHACYLSESGEAKCWGLGTTYGLGDGNNSNSLVPVTVVTTELFKDLEAASGVTCGLEKDNGYLYCWGTNGAFSDTVPTLLDSSRSYTKLSGGAGHFCLLSSGGDIYCLGDAAQGQLGNGTTNPATVVPQLVTGSSGDYIDVGCGYYHCCGVKSDSSVYCWGNNFYGQLGSNTNLGTNNANSSPIVSNLTASSLADSFTYNSCGISGGVTSCVGRYNGDHTVNSDSAQITPQALIGNPSSTAISDYNVICGIYSGVIKCQGDETTGQLGNGGGLNDGLTTFVAIDSSQSFTYISAGDDFFCAITDGVEVYCWGENATGNLGDNSTTNRDSPVLVNGF